MKISNWIYLITLLLGFGCVTTATRNQVSGTEGAFRLFDDYSELLDELEDAEVFALEGRVTIPDIKYFAKAKDPLFRQSPGLLFYQVDGLEAKPIGIVQRDGEDLMFYYDFLENKTLVEKSRILLAPYGAYLDAPIPRDSELTYFGLYDIYFNIFKSDEGPIGHADEMTQAQNVMAQLMKNETLANRDLLYIFLYYAFMNQDATLEAMASMYNMIQSYYQRFGGPHPLFYLYLEESIMNSGYDPKNINPNPFTVLLSFDPDFVPAKVYMMQLEKNSAEKKRLFESLKDEHPDHWIVKQL
jgi:hypothetical protein